MKNIFLGIDIGTTSIKAAAFDEKGKRVAKRNIDYTLITDPKTGYIEFEADKYVEMCKDAIKSISDEVGNIISLSVDTQGETLILTDFYGKPLCNAVVWLDNRAEDEAEEIRNVFGDKRVYETTGQPQIAACLPAPKFLWFKRHRPDVWKKTEKIFLLEDYILFSLSKKFVTEPTIQSSTLYFDIGRKKWWFEMLDYIGISPDKLPQIMNTAEQIGEYKGVKVVTGGLDQIAGTVGVGAVDNSCISEMTGTIMAISSVCDKIPPYRAVCIIPCHVHAVEGKYCRLMWSAAAGLALKWFRNNFAENFSFKELDEIASEISPGCDGMTFLPYLNGSTMPVYDPCATASFVGVTLAHTRGHFARSIMESVAFMLKQNLDYISSDKDCEIHITGGGAYSKLWSQIKADVTGRKLYTLKESESACLGAAVLAAAGIGYYNNIEDAVHNFVILGDEYLPGSDDYRKPYDRFIKANKLLLK